MENDKGAGTGEGVQGNPGEITGKRGKLKIFLSYAPGTGKTLAMLEDGYRRLISGGDVVIGFVESHGDLTIATLLDKFEVIPRRMIIAAGITYYGMNLDMVLSRRPQLVLVDHLTQSEPPEPNHKTLYQEVEELLDAGIDVYATLNYFQVESQVETVASLTGVTIHDTLPDRILDEADILEMVDMPPQELFALYQEGSVPFHPFSDDDARKLFALGNLFTLRELNLRYMARRSNSFMRSLMAGQALSGKEIGMPLLLVCISDSPSAVRLIRAGRRMADETRSEWAVIHVETPEEVNREEENLAYSQNVRLAELLGASVVSVTGRSVERSLSQYVLQNHIRRVMIGRSPRHHWFRLSGASLAEHLLRDDPTISVYVVGSDYTPRPFQMPQLWHMISRLQLLGSLGLVTITTLLGLVLTPTIISRSANLAMLYLLAVVIASVTLGLVPALLTALLSALSFKYFFVPPLYQLFQFTPEYALTFTGFLMVGVIISTLVSRERALANAAQRRAEQVTQLYELSRDLAVAVDMPEVLETVLQHIRHTFDRDAVIFLPRNGELVLSASNAGQTVDSSELTAAEWAFQQGRPAGSNTGTFSYASFRYFPLETSHERIGVVGVSVPAGARDLNPDQMRHLGAYVTKAASAVERALLAEEASQAQVLRAAEKLQSALLNSISHDLRTPLASITGVLDSLRMDDGVLDSDTRRELVETAYGEAVRLNRLVGNLLDMTRLESGTMRIIPQPCDVQDVIGAALNALAGRLEGHPINVEIPVDLPLVPIDFVLINQVLINLLENAAKYSSDSGPINILAVQHGDQVHISIEDHGPGIPEEDLQRIFEKFYRVKRFENVVGTGLGLSICKGIIEVHGGKIWAENRLEGGARIVFTLPLKPAGIAAREPDAEPLKEEIRS
jgi:two-component system sensor histidine kinase KdpD